MSQYQLIVKKYQLASMNLKNLSFTSEFNIAVFFQNHMQPLIIIGCWFLLVLLMLWAKHYQKKYRWLYKTSLTIVVLLSLFSLGIWVYQENLFNISDKTRHISMVREQVRFNKKISADNTSVVTIQKMVMREAQTEQRLKKQGFVSIPSQGILLPIYNDAYSTVGLNAGANYANRSQNDPEGDKIPIMGQGNYGLAAHNFNDGRTGFSSLQESTNHNAPYYVKGQLNKSSWLNGKYILLANNKGIYRYSIVGQTTVSEDDTAILNDSQTPKLTIVSCLFPSVQYRIVTHAKLVQVDTWNHASRHDVNQFNLKIRATNAHASWYNPGIEEGANGDAGGTKP
ncbi:class A sortase [Leuconostoc citreum]|uniref:class A sortase n=1 Tax=Leuconostoc citreum TaxID=33964 RepID=UPI001C1F826F|nr:class A sortase [Leuconostoc citreum]